MNKPVEPQAWTKRWRITIKRNTACTVILSPLRFTEPTHELSIVLQVHGVRTSARERHRTDDVTADVRNDRRRDRTA